jgi:hypothetical protein
MERPGLARTLHKQSILAGRNFASVYLCMRLLTPLSVHSQFRRPSDRDNAAGILRKPFDILPGQIQMLHEQLRGKVTEPGALGYRLR